MSLTPGWFLGRAADLTSIKRGRVRDDDGVDYPTNVEHPEQRQALLAALAATLNVLPLIKAWAAWPAATAIDMRNYAGVEIQVTAVAAATFTRSGDGASYVATSATASGSPVSAAAPGFYNLKGGGFLKWVGTGTILIRGYN